MTNPPKAKPEVAQVHALLQEFNVILVHFSYIGKGEKLAQVVDGKEPHEWKAAIDENLHLFYPEDLKLCFGNTHYRLSCSTIRPKDVQRNAVGSVGVVLDLEDKQSLKLVRRADAGTPPSLKEIVDEDITAEDCAKTIRCRPEDDYNEWLVQGFKPIGIFVFSQPTYSVFGPYHDGEITWPIAKIRHDFAGYRIFTADSSGFFEITDGSPTTTTVGSLYP